MIRDLQPAAPEWMTDGTCALLVLLADIVIASKDTGDAVRIENLHGNRIALCLSSGNEAIDVFHTFEPKDSSVTRGLELRDWLQRCGVTARAVGFPVVRR